MAEYQAKEGQEDRHGEMTGAISVNMVFCAVPVISWCIFIGPMLMDFWPMLGVALAMSIVLPILLLKPSQWVWAKLSDVADKFEFD